MNYFFVRHILSLGNIDPSIYHTMNDYEIDICEKHTQQAEDAALEIVDLFYSLGKRTDGFYLYHSPFLRTRKTKDYILSELAHHYIFPTVQESPLLIERQWGDLRTLIETKEDLDKYFNFFYKPTNNGESFLECYQRCVIFDNMLKNQLTDDSNVIVVGHGEQIKCYLMHLLGWTLEEFDSYKNPNNCEVMMVTDGKLSSKTPLRKRIKN